MAKALVRFLAAQHVERDGVERRFYEGCSALWRPRDPEGYHVEYGYSTMGDEIRYERSGAERRWYVAPSENPP
ncbi:MAG: hypothetical protein DLM67_09615 [Candidatus Nephthysia bennettiae]|uniref:Uncharacterized protein n=1 Tax=Candidatus Nephthysia bennettiae TaxID=3127016 RepID=A0A934NFL6_9BACT|nr:hypothetical protein [Candidatus Dormibacteraeota bacterium]MBJ7613304.1 hypothetical protein [Candidatus Dormibacteraeota bacterium]PZR96326.1 MAG: hypothetical protein DLM67_09615 [Candidatus Dormibacteraeota bacterium]